MEESAAQPDEDDGQMAEVSTEDLPRDLLKVTRVAVEIVSIGVEFMRFMSLSRRRCELSVAWCCVAPTYWESIWLTEPELTEINTREAKPTVHTSLQMLCPLRTKCADRRRPRIRTLSIRCWRSCFLLGRYRHATSCSAGSPSCCRRWRSTKKVKRLAATLPAQRPTGGAVELAHSAQVAEQLAVGLGGAHCTPRRGSAYRLGAPHTGQRCRPPLRGATLPCRGHSGAHIAKSSH